MAKKRDFLRKIVEEDLKSKKYSEVVPDFHPEPTVSHTLDMQSR